ncbi:hypothetical protein, partial [Streptomyces sp. URMC 123]|uniref:hypothetical protein n=1 Tax=Streptomyces sp. URMC 123 TaxID=3423403 RepID=UPI003F1BDBC4
AVLVREEDWRRGAAGLAGALGETVAAVVVEAPSVGGAAPEQRSCRERIRALRALRPDLELGVLVRAPGTGDDALRRAVGSVEEPARASAPDLVVVGPGPCGPGENRVAQMVLGDELHGAVAARVVLLCRPEEL